MTITALDTLLSVLHDRGVVNETQLEAVCVDLFEGQPLTREHLIQIFGIAPIFRLVTIPDETARQLVREAYDVLNNPQSPIDLRDWSRAAKALLGPEES